jgi:hypothetical protein
MKNLNRAVALAGCLAGLAIGSGKAVAQGRGNFDPQQMMERRLEAYRDQMEVKDDTEWTAISAKITAVMEAQRALMSNQAGMRGMFGGGRRRNADDGNGNGDQAQRPRRNGFMQPSPALEDLQKAIEAKAPSAEIKEKLAKLRADTAEKQAKLEKAQEDLKTVLTSRREAVAVLGGLLK